MATVKLHFQSVFFSNADMTMLIFIKLKVSNWGKITVVQ